MGSICSKYLRTVHVVLRFSKIRTLGNTRRTVAAKNQFRINQSVVIKLRIPRNRLSYMRVLVVNLWNYKAFRDRDLNFVVAQRREVR